MAIATNGSKGASTASPTVNSGASTASSPAAESSVTTPVSSRAAIRADIERMQGDAEVDVDDNDDGTGSEGNQPTSKDTEKNAAADADPKAEKSKDDKGKDGDEKKVPLSALKKAEEKARKKLDDARGQLHVKDLALKKSNEALKLAAKEVERLQGLLRQGAKFDEQGERIAGMELERAASQVDQRLTKEHEKVLEEAKREVTLSIEAESLDEEIATALVPRDGLFDRAALIREMRKDLSKSPEEAAAALETQILERARPRLVKSQPTHPASVRAQRGGGTNTAVEYGHDRKGIREHAEALERARRANSQ